MRFILSVMLLSALAILVACQSSAAPTSVNSTATNTPPPQTAKPAPPSGDHNHKADEEAPRITLADAKKAFDAGNALFVDTRYADGYKLEHVKGAINIPANEIETRYSEIPKGKTIIAYCS